MKVKITHSFNLSRRISVSRPFVDGMRARDGLLFVSVAYRKGRAFYCLDGGKTPRYAAHEDEIGERGLGQYRCIAVDPAGSLMLAGSFGENVRVFTLDGDGNTAMARVIPGVSLLSSMAAREGHLYLHSPLFPRPVRRYGAGGEYESLGSYPVEDGDAARKMAQIHVDGEGFLWVIYESAPPCVCRYDPAGREVFFMVMEDFPPSLDAMVPVLDSCPDPGTGLMLLLLDRGRGKKRLLRAVSPEGREAGEAEMERDTRRICAGGDGALYLSGTRFSLASMVFSLSIYGSTITTVEKARLEWEGAPAR
jgi:hypothetical protein